jgi:hypothetical protein
MTRHFLPWKAPAHGLALLEAVERRAHIGSRHHTVKRRRGDSPLAGNLILPGEPL